MAGGSSVSAVDRHTPMGHSPEAARPNGRSPTSRKTPAAPTGMSSVQQLTMKRKILEVVQRLSDRDCADTAVLELREAAQQVGDGDLLLICPKFPLNIPLIYPQ